MSNEKDKNNLIASIVRLEESMKNITLELQDIKGSISKLQEQDIKRHDEVRECYYVAETTRKRHEEIKNSCHDRFNHLGDGLKSIYTKLDKHEQDAIIQEKEENKQKYTTFLTIIKYVLIASAAIIAGIIGGDFGSIISMFVKKV